MSDPLKDKLAAVNDEVAGLKQDAQAKWQAFEKQRDEFAAAGSDVNDVESDAFKAVHDAHRQYGEVRDLIAAKERVRDGLLAMVATSGPAAANVAAPAASQGKSLDQEIKDLSAVIADRVVGSDGFKAVQHALQVESARIGIQSLGEASTRDEAKALITGASDTSGGAFITNERVGMVAAGYRRATLLNLVTMASTNSDAVDYAREDVPVLNAAETAEATTLADGLKPEAEMTFTKVTEAVRTIANWIPATRRSLQDVGQLRAMIERRLRYALEFRLEAQIVNGNGTGENFRGILNTSGILTQAKATDTVVEAVHKAMTQIRLGFFEPNGVALHPNDWQAIRLDKNSQGDYYYGPPALAGTEMVWGLPVVSTPAVPENTGIVGDWGAATLWLRSGVQVLASDSHSDFFVRNLIAILAELRAAFGVQQPKAFASVTGI